MIEDIIELKSFRLSNIGALWGALFKTFTPKFKFDKMERKRTQ